jgi:hypothetical protein
MRNRLLTFGALCIVGTINTALFGGGTALAVGLASNILAADLGALWDKVANRLRGRDAVLQSEGLSQAVAKAIAKARQILWVTWAMPTLRRATM